MALLVRDVLWLRGILMISQTLMISFSIVSSRDYITFWNGVFFTINTVQVIRLLLERRPIVLPPELEEIYNRVFSVMEKREFLYFWNTGKIFKVENDFLCEEGKVPQELMLIFKGEVSVMKNKKEVVKLQKGAFVAEMSFMTGEGATADVKAIGDVEFIAWDSEKLANLKLANPDLMIKIQVILGKDLTEKLKQRS